jgi:hypothetical protein
MEFASSLVQQVNVFIVVQWIVTLGQIMILLSSLFREYVKFKELCINVKLIMFNLMYQFNRAIGHEVLRYLFKH